MEQLGILHVIQDDLTTQWIAEATESGVEAIEDYLAKHLAFLGYLDDDAAAPRR